MEKIQWHPAFCSATELELRENRDDLVFDPEHNLSRKPLQMDMLVIKKKNDTDIKNEIGKIFRKHNIIEYKGENDSLSIDVFYKVLGYACLYKSLGRHVNEIPAEEITVTFIRHAYPKELFENLSAMGIGMEEKFPGIYYADRDILFPVQFIVTKALDSRKHASLKIVTSKAEERDIRQFLMDMMGAKEPGDLHNVDAVLQASVSANSKLYEKVRGEDIMCQALRELMKDEIDKEIEENRKEAKKDTTLDAIRNIMETLKYSAVQAMDILKVPASERDFYMTKL